MALYTDSTIYNIVEGVNSKYFLPDIQRPYVWTQDQIYALFDSIMRGYPISTFLFWEIKKDYLREQQIKKFKFISNNEESNPEDTNLTNSEYQLVLDGQQRITTLYIALKGHYIVRRKKKELFLNILSGKEDDDDGLVYEFKFLDYTGQDVVQEDNKIWVNVKSVYSCIDVSQKRKLREKVSNLTDDKTTVEENIDILFGRLKSDPILNFYTEKEEDYDRVLDIFIRTNAGGTKLTYSDLLFSTIKLRWRDARDNFKNLIDDINGETFDFDNDFILKTCFVIFAENQQDIKYSKKNVDDKNKIDKIIQNWPKIVESIKLTRDLLSKMGIVHGKLLTSNNALIPIVYYIYVNNLKSLGDPQQKNVISKENEELMKNFLMSSLLTGLFGGQTDTILWSMKGEIDMNNNPYFPLGQIRFAMSKKNKDMNITADFLDGVSYKDKNSYLVLNSIYSGINYNPTSKNNLPEQDHIFSRDELKTSGYTEDEINSIFNIRYVESGSNKRKTNQPFKEWIATLSAQKREEHLIPEGTWGTNNYNEFLKARKELILEKMQGLLVDKSVI